MMRTRFLTTISPKAARRRSEPKTHGASLLVVVLLGLPVPALAQNAGGGITLGGSAPPPQTCVQVQIAGQQGSPYSCLNQELAGQANQATGAPPSIPLAANSPANKVGTFNKTGLAEQYGQNFGKSVIPYRPPPPAYSNPLH